MRKFLIIATMLLSFSLIYSPNASAKNELDINGSITDYLTEDSDEQVYTIEVEAAGKINLNIISEVNYLYYYLYDENNNSLYSDSFGGSTSTPGKISEDLYLEPGTYTLIINDGRYNTYTGKYSVTLSYEAAQTDDREPNNGVSNAQIIQFDELTEGYLTINDEDDYFKFTVKQAGTIDMDLIGYITNTTYYAVYDDQNNELTSDSVSSTPVNPSKSNITMYLEPGDYYIRVYEGKYSTNYGKFTLNLHYEKAEVNESEPNDGTVTANSILFGKKVSGFISWNNTEDYYKFAVTKKGNISLSLNGYLTNSTFVKVIDDYNNTIWSTSEESSSQSPAKIKETFTLSPGTYYIVVYKGKYNSYYGRYDFILSGGGITSFKDYDENAYWVEPFVWGMENSIINGDSVTNKLNPNSPIKEAQWLALLLRYAIPNEAKDATTGSWYSTYYTLAKKYNISVTNNPNGTLRRGNVARMLAQVYLGKSLTEQQAVQWMYEHKITTGVNPSSGKTYNNFNPDGKISRAQAITFMYRLESKGITPILKN